MKIRTWSIALALALLHTAASFPAAAPADPPRIVSLAPHLTELAFTAGAGDKLAGVVEWSDFPLAARALPRIGDAFRFDAETIIALQATDALVWDGGTPEATIEQLRELGIEVHSIQTGTLDDIAAAIAIIGEIAGSSAAAADARRRFQKQRATLEAKAPAASDVEVFYQVSERPLFTLGSRHVINEVLALCGARNVFDGLRSEAAPIGLEAVIDAAPDVILVGGRDGLDSRDERWLQHPEIPAVRCGWIHAVDPNTLIRPTTRILDGARSLCEWMDNTVRRTEREACRQGER